MIPLSLKDCAWDKERATLTVNLSSFRSEHWGQNNTFTIESHVTGVGYIFQGGSTNTHYKDRTGRAYWICVPLDNACPIKQVFIADRYASDVSIFRHDPATARKTNP